MESVQEAFIMLDVFDKLKDMKKFQKYALVLHAINLRYGFKCTGYLEDDPKYEEKEGKHY